MYVVTTSEWDGFMSFLRANRSYAKASKMIDGRGCLTMGNT